MGFLPNGLDPAEDKRRVIVQRHGTRYKVKNSDLGKRIIPERLPRPTGKVVHARRRKGKG